MIQVQRIVALPAIQHVEQGGVFVRSNVLQVEPIIAGAGGKDGGRLTAMRQRHGIVTRQQVDRAREAAARGVSKVYRLLVNVHDHAVCRTGEDTSAVAEGRGVAVIDIHHLSCRRGDDIPGLLDARRATVHHQRGSSGDIINMNTDPGFDVAGGIGGHAAAVSAVDIDHQPLRFGHVVICRRRGSIGIFQQKTGSRPVDVNGAAVGLCQRSSSAHTRASSHVESGIEQLNAADFSFVFDAVSET